HRARRELSALEPTPRAEHQRDVRRDREHNELPPARVLGDHDRDRYGCRRQTDRRVAQPFHREGSRAPVARMAARTTASAAITNSAAGWPEVLATVPAMSGPRKKPKATELALNPKTVH